MGDPAESEVDLAERIRMLERERLRALVDADLVVADVLRADDFELVNPAGATLTKAEYLGGIASGEIDYLVFEPDSEIAVRAYGEAVAIRYRSRLEIVVGGHHVPLRHYWHTDLYARRAGAGRSSGPKPPKSSDSWKGGPRPPALRKPGYARLTAAILGPDATAFFGPGR